jgi:class 3 adenylate cyclase/tetratricopeptide (TPR) repeat protein
MTFEEILDQAIAMLQRRGRVTYRLLQRQFQLDDDTLSDLLAELRYAHGEVISEDEQGMVWTGGAAVLPTPPPSVPQPFQPSVSQEAPATQADGTPTTSSTPDAERRQLTVMFCDLVDSTKLSSQLDPEDYRDMVRAYQRVCSEVIARFDGHIAQLLGDGLLVYFGYPQAHEDDAQRAVRTGLGILAILADLNQGLHRATGIQLALRLGIHTGLVVVGAMGGAGHQEQLALGETPNIAARIQGLAAPNTLVISDATHRLVQGYFACQDLGGQTLRGVTESMRVYHVRSESGATSRLEVAQPRGLTPLVGRESEVTLLLERWEQAKTGHGHVVLVSGEAGIGKSRLVQTLKEHVAHEPHMRWECRSAEYSQNMALFPLVDLFQRLLQFQAEDTPDKKLGKLEQMLSQYRLPVAESVQLFAPLLSVPLPEHHYPPLHLSPQRQRQKTLEMIVAILLELAERQPVLLILEDLHWTDPSTLELLNLLVEQVPTTAIATLLTCRPHFQPAWHHRSYITEMTLHHLSPTQVAQIVTGMTAGKPFPAAVLQQIIAKTDGVPLFVEELTKAIVASGQLTAVDGHYELIGSLSTFAIPATLQDSLMARLDRLVTAKGVAQLGATMGRQFAYELLQAVSSLAASTLQRELGRLVEAEIVYQRGLPPQALYTFKHALIQDAAYESLLRSTRQQYHQRIAQVLAERFPETAETQPEVVAQHYTAAGVHDQALPYWQRAGQRALERSAHREAKECFEQALRALSHLPETRATREQAIDLRLALRSALLPAGDYGRTLEVLHEAESLAVALDDSRRLGRVLGYLAIHCNQQGVYDQACAIAQRVLALATAAGNAVQQALTNDNLGTANRAQGNYRQAIAYCGQTAAFFDGARCFEHFGQFFLPAVRSRAYLAWCHAELGMFAEGRVLADEGLRIAEEADHLGSLMYGYFGIGLLAFRQGDLPRALSRLEHALGLCQDADLPLYFPLIAPALGVVHALSGRVADAVSLLTQALEQVLALARVDYQAFCRLSLGEAQVLAGRLEEAHALAESALTHTQRHQERGNEAYALRLLGDLVARCEPPQVELAEAYFRQALALADELGMRPLMAHCQRGLGQLYAATGQWEQARAALSVAIDLYRAMDMTFWLPQTESALAQVEGQ